MHPTRPLQLFFALQSTQRAWEMLPHATEERYALRELSPKVLEAVEGEELAGSSASPDSVRSRKTTMMVQSSTTSSSSAFHRFRDSFTCSARMSHTLSAYHSLSFPSVNVPSRYVDVSCVRGVVTRFRCFKSGGSPVLCFNVKLLRTIRHTSR